MSNPAVVKLDRNHVNKSMVWLDDNFGESIHIHIDDIRVDLTVEEFKSLNDDLGFILNDLLRIDNFDITKIDPVYLSLWLWPRLSMISSVSIDTIKLGDMFVRSMDGKRIEKLEDSVEIKALNNVSKENDTFKRESNHVGQTDTQRLQGILDSIKANGYPYDGKYIILFGNDNLIRDGQHRASCLYYLFGDIEVPVMRIYFKDSGTKEILTNRKRLFYNSNLGFFSRRFKGLVMPKIKTISKGLIAAIKPLLRSIGIRKRMFEKNIYKLDSEIDSFYSR